MSSRDREYFSRRAEQETAAANQSTCAFVRGVHLDLAGRYLAKVRLMDALGSDPAARVAEIPPLRGSVDRPSDC